MLDFDPARFAAVVQALLVRFVHEGAAEGGRDGERDGERDGTL